MYPKPLSTVRLTRDKVHLSDMSVACTYSIKLHFMSYGCSKQRRDAHTLIFKSALYSVLLSFDYGV
jgi:hypothetical protein